MGVKFEIKAKTGEDKSGKAFYTKIGVVLQGEKGFTMKLNTIPLGWDGFAFFSEPEQRQGAPRQQQPARQGYGGGRQAPAEDAYDDEIPF